MPALSNIAIADGAATPVTHTFAPVTTDGYVAKLKERIGVPIGYPGLDASVRPPVNGNGIYREKFVLSMPVTATVDGVTKVDFSQSVTVEFVMSDKGDEQSRKNLRVLAANLLGHATVVSMVEKLEPIF